MCLAIPARIVSVQGIHAWVEIFDVRQKVNIQLVDTPAPGDYILVHAGFAIEKIDPEYFGFLNETLDRMMEDRHNE